MNILIKKLILHVSLIFIFGCAGTKTSNNESSPLDLGQDQSTIAKTDLADMEKECKNQEISKAIKNLNIQYVNYKTDPNYWNLIGACFLQDFSPLKARLFFLRALEEDKNNGAALNNLGVVYWSLDKHYDALSYFKRAEQVDSRSLAVKYNLARLYAWYGLHKNSDEKYSQIPSDQFPNQDFNYIGTNQLMLSQYDKAINSFKNTRQNESKFKALYAVALKKVGQQQDADALWKQARVSEADPISWLWMLGE